MSMSLGIIGFPIGHSISPVFQQAALDYHGIDATYRAWEVAPSDLPIFLNDLRSPAFLGINVTVPHKEAVMHHLDRVDDWASWPGPSTPYRTPAESWRVTTPMAWVSEGAGGSRGLRSQWPPGPPAGGRRLCQGGCLRLGRIWGRPPYDCEQDSGQGRTPGGPGPRPGTECAQPSTEPGADTLGLLAGMRT